MKHKIESLSFSGNHLKLRVDGNDYRIALPMISAKLAGATKVERATFRVSPAGFGIHWPLLDEDLTTDGLIRAATRSEPLKRSA